MQMMFLCPVTHKNFLCPVTLKLLHDVQELQPLDFPETGQEPNNEIQNAY